MLDILESVNPQDHGRALRLEISELPYSEVEDNRVCRIFMERKQTVSLAAYEVCLTITLGQEVMANCVEIYRLGLNRRRILNLKASLTGVVTIP